MITRGFGDALQIGYQARPNIFAREIILPERLYQQVIEVNERVKADGTVLEPLNIDDTRSQLQTTYSRGYPILCNRPDAWLSIS